MAEASVVEKPTRLYSQLQLADSYERMGKLYSMQAAASKAPAYERAADWRQAREWHQKALEVWDRWSSIGVSSAFNVSRRNQTVRAIARCEEALTALEGQWH